MPQYAPLAIANHFISSYGSGEGIEHMKLQKLVYCSHGWWLISKPDPLLIEKPQLWNYGPVFKSMYRALRTYGRNPIRQPVSASPFEEPDDIKADDITTKRLVSWVWRRYGHWSAYSLSEMTHKPGTAWYETAKQYEFSVPEHLPLSDDAVRTEFRKYATNEAVAGA
jgi:uncharacterized phage-associated protein